MAIQLSVAVRNARLDAVETATGASAKLAVFAGAVPANCASANPSGELLRITCPADYFAAAANGSKAFTAPWTATATGTGTPASFRLYAADGTTCHMQGTAGVGSGDLSLDGTCTAGQSVSITGFTMNEPGA